MLSKSTKVIAVGLSMSFFLATIATAAEKAAVKEAIKEAVKDPKAAAQKVIPKQVKREGGSAGATAVAAKACEKASAEFYPTLHRGDCGRLFFVCRAGLNDVNWLD